MKRTPTSPAAKLIERVLRQECESVHGRIAQANRNSESDRAEGILGFRRGVKKIRCALSLSAGGFNPEQRTALDSRWASLARRLGTFREFDAQQAEIDRLIARLPPTMHDEVRRAWTEGCAEIGGQACDSDRRETLESLGADAERVIAATETLRLDDLSPELVAGSVHHIWKRAQVQAKKSWKGRDEAWLHALRKRIQHTHIAFRLLRGRTGERGMELEKRFDAAAKTMGELRDISMIRIQLAALAAKRPLQPSLEILRTEVLRSELEAMKAARKAVQKAFKPKLTRVLRDIGHNVRSL